MSNLRKIELLDFFEKTGYDWRKDLEVMRTICGLTKTRPKENMSEFKFTDGHEQTFFMKALAEHNKTKNFLLNYRLNS